MSAPTEDDVRRSGRRLGELLIWAQQNRATNQDELTDLVLRQDGTESRRQDVEVLAHIRSMGFASGNADLNLHSKPRTLAEILADPNP